jgi:hypothetical protein
MSRLVLVIISIFGVVSVTTTWGKASPQAPSGITLAQSLRFVDQRLDRALRLLNTAEELVTVKRMDKADRAIGQALPLLRDAERSVGNALNMFRQAEATKPSKGQFEQVQRLSTEGRQQLRETTAIVERTAQKNANYKKLRGLLIGADKQMDQVLKMLSQIVAGL